ncbi:MAG: hypothetical protein KBT20_08905 [Bacteroidales bacterium]|nr:hypothetical protein [Candidatus Liminaster caballi]
MKKSLILTLAMVATLTTVNAQEHRHTHQTDSDQQTATDSTIVYNNMLSRTNNTWSINFLSIMSEPENKPSKCTGHSKNTMEVGAMDLFLGYAGIGKTEGFTQSPDGSLEFGFNFVRGHWSLNKRNTWGIENAFGVSWTRYRTEDNAVFLHDADNNLICTPWLDENDQKKNYSHERMTYVSWRAPLMLTHKNPKLKTGFSIGAEAEMRHHIRSRVKMNGEKRYDVLRHGMSVNHWGCNAIVKLTYHDVSLYGRYSLTPFFDSSHTKLQGTPFSIGLSLDLD